VQLSYLGKNVKLEMANLSQIEDFINMTMQTLDIGHLFIHSFIHLYLLKNCDTTQRKAKEQS